jgi:hypothetical protein
MFGVCRSLGSWLYAPHNFVLQTLPFLLGSLRPQSVLSTAPLRRFCAFSGLELPVLDLCRVHLGRPILRLWRHDHPLVALRLPVVRSLLRGLEAR